MNMTESTSPAIGIDLGTTYCCVAIVEDEEVNIIYNTEGKRTTPSYISFTKTDCIVGYLAKALKYKNLSNTVYDVKRLIGRKFDDPLVQCDMKHWPFTVIDDDNIVKIRVEHKGSIKELYPEQISAKLLSYLKEIAETYTGKVVSDAVITVPAYFNNSQRQATKFAAEIAGLNVLRILNEPTAAAIAYGLKIKNKENILVYDLGGGTFDVSIIEINNEIYTVKAVKGNNHLGGEDINRNMVDYFIKKIQKLHKVDISKDRKAVSRLHHKCEEVKEILSTANQTEFDIEYIFETISFSSRMTKTEFENLNAHLFEMTIDVVKQCLNDSKLDKIDIDKIVMVGGSSRIPKLKLMLQDFFTNAQISKTINPDESVAMGAAIFAAQIKGITTKTRRITLNDVTSHSLGTCEGFDDKMYTFIEKNSTIPIKKSKKFKTLYDNQSKMCIRVIEGDSKLTSENWLLGECPLDCITQAPAGQTKFHVTFNIDDNGILTVHSKEKNKEIVLQNKITITHSDLWLKDDIKRMTEELKTL